jgi:alkylhydroperoxidase family enzyme
MALVSIPSDKEASPQQKSIFRHSKILFGRVANAVRVGSHAPKLMQILFGFIVSALREEITENLPVRTKCLVILKTSTLNGCAYWTGHNETLGRALDFSEELIETVTGDYLNSALFTAEEKAAMRWAEIMTNKLYQSGPGTPPQHRLALSELKKHYNESQIVELSFVSGFFNFWNRFTDVLEIDIEQGSLMTSFSKSTKINPNDFSGYMRECWWNADQEKSTQR